jgi:hypothetical protein
VLHDRLGRCLFLVFAVELHDSAGLAVICFVVNFFAFDSIRYLALIVRAGQFFACTGRGSDSVILFPL